MDARTLPTGTVAFLFTDVEGSTRLWERDRAAMAVAVERHLALLRRAVEAHGGTLFKVVGDGTQSAFRTVPEALAAGVEAQLALRAEPWPAPLATLPVRAAVHCGVAAPRGGDYLAPCLNRLSRLLDAGFGGQILLSETAAGMAGEALPPLVTLRDLGPHRLRDLLGTEPVFQALRPGLPVDFPPLRTLDRAPNNLPVQLTSFVGREEEVAQAAAILAGDCRLLTLTGPPGVGKTRLALQVAAELVEEFPDGVAFVALAPLTSPEQVPGAIAGALTLPEEPGRPVADALRDHLAERRHLLLLDNFEHLLAAAPLVGDLLAATAQVAVLTTSRAPLHLRGEREFAVAPLPLPAPESDPSANEAVRLFAARAVVVDQRFRLDDDTAAQVAGICRRLDGLPLAIELAAARTKLLPPAAILRRLEQRLPTLAAGPRDAPARQRTLHDTVAWSHDLLDDEQRRLFRRLAVFAGGCTLESAEAVADHDGALGPGLLDALAALVDGSLLHRAESPDAAEPRFTMLQLLRDFASEQLELAGEREPVQVALRAHLLDLVARAGSGLLGPEQEAWLDRLDAELDNLRADLRRPGVDAATTLRLAAGLRHFWRVRGHYEEGRATLTAALAAPGAEAAPAALRAEARQGLGFLALDAGDYDGAEQEFATALALREAADDLAGSAEPLRGLGLVALNRHDLERAQSLNERALAAARAADDARAVAFALHNLGAIARERGDLAAARANFADSLGHWTTLGDQMWTAQCQLGLGIVDRIEGDERRARGNFEACLAGSARIADQYGVGQASVQLGHLARQNGDAAEAASRYRAAVDAYRSVGATEGVVEASEWLAAAWRGLGHAELGAELLGAAADLRRRNNLPTPPRTDADLSAIAAEAKTAHPEAWAHGSAATVESLLEAVPIRPGASGAAVAA